MRILPASLALFGLVAACTRHPDVPSGKAGASAQPSPTVEPATPAPPALGKKRVPSVSMPALAREDACAFKAGKAGPAKGNPKPYSRVDGRCDEGLCDWVGKAPPGADRCFVADDNIAKAERESRSAKPSATGKGVTSATTYLDRVDAHLHLDARERKALDESGFVVMERARYLSYAVAFHDVFQQQLPVYVSADAILNAVFQSTQTLLESAERNRLAPRLVKMIPRMRSTLVQQRAFYGAETVADLDLYLGVAAGLLDPYGNRKVQVPEAATALVEHAKEADGLQVVDLFGRARMIDFSQLKPRGHYATAQSIDLSTPPKEDGTGGDFMSISFEDYFRTMMWLSRLEFNLVSRSSRSSQPGAEADPSETPREARDALALADLVRRSGSLGDLAELESVYSTFAGRREDVSVPDLLGFGIAPNDPKAPEKLRAKIGNGFQRTARIHYMPHNTPVLPAIATLFGPRIAPDTAPLTGLVHDAVGNRTELGAPDVAYLLGHDRARKYLTADLAEFPTLGPALDKGRVALAESVKTKTDVYGTWLRAVSALAEPPAGVVPSFMKTEAFADARMASSLAGYAQIRHTFVLLAGQGYDAYGCEIPDGWVEPALGMYDALLAWANAARAANPTDKEYFARLTSVLGMLRGIAKTELDGKALSEPQRRWLGMIAEYTPVGGYGAGDSGEPPKYTGWYFDLFPDREKGAERRVDIVADYFTLTNANQVRYLGIDRAALGVFVVDTGGAKRAMVGPVAIPYETVTPIASRLDDKAARQLEHPRAPWLGYVVPEAEEPTLAADFFACDGDARVVVRAPAAVGNVTVELLDHHGDVITSPITLPVGNDPAVFAFKLSPAMLKSKHGVEGFHVRAREQDFVSGVGVYGTYDPDAEPGENDRRTKHQLLLGDIANRAEGGNVDRDEMDGPGYAIPVPMPPVPPMPVPSGGAGSSL